MMSCLEAASARPEKRYGRPGGAGCHVPVTNEQLCDIIFYNTFYILQIVLRHCNRSAPSPPLPRPSDAEAAPACGGDSAGVTSLWLGQWEGVVLGERPPVVGTMT